MTAPPSPHTAYDPKNRTRPMSTENHACYSCGATAEPGRRPMTFTAMHVEGQHPAVAATRGAKLRTVELGECSECRSRHELASLLVTGKPNGRDGTVTTDRLGAALDALAILGKPMPKQGDSIGTLMRHLTTPGSLARWAARYAPMWSRGAKADERNAEAWAHVSDEQRRALREGYSRVLAERVAASAPPVALTPPPAEEGKGSPVEGGCLFCGVPAVAMDAQRVVARGGTEQARAEVWTPTSADATALGGRSSGRLRGHLCPSCADSKQAVGSVGPNALERAYTRHMRTIGRGDDLPSLAPGEHLSGLSAWAVTARTENREPWEHTARPRE